MNTKAVYQLDDYNFYVGETIAFESPLEPGVYHIPRNAVEEQPPQVTKPSEVCQYVKGKWVVRDLEEELKQKLEEEKKKAEEEQKRFEEEQKRLDEEIERALKEKEQFEEEERRRILLEKKKLLEERLKAINAGLVK